MEKNKKIANIIIICIFLGAIIFLSLSCIGISKRNIRSFIDGKVDFKTFTDNLKADYVDGVPNKYDFINLNGLFLRMTARRKCNTVVRLKDGNLSVQIAETNVEPYAEKIIDLAKHSEQSDIPFIFVLAPYKEDLTQELYPIGLESYANKNADRLLSLLEQSNVRTLDLRPYFVSTPEDIRENFFTTDHHWTPEGALKATRIIVETLSSLSTYDINTELFAPDNWEAHTLTDWFLGSRGRRSGVFFGGVDDFTYYTPKFNTQLSLSIPNHHAVRSGSFADANMDLKYLKGIHYFDDDVYAMYMGGNYPISMHRNAYTDCEVQALFISDSFMLPVECFLSTALSEIDVLDPRRFVECSCEQYIDDSNPDIVMMMCGPSMFTSTYFNNTFFDSSVKYIKGTTTLEEKHDLLIKENNDTDNNFVFFGPSLSAGDSYRITLDNVTFTGSVAGGITVCAFDKEAHKVILERSFDVEYYNKTNQKITWVLHLPKKIGDTQVIIYSGLRQQTRGCGTTIDCVILEKLNE